MLGYRFTSPQNVNKALSLPMSLAVVPVSESQCYYTYLLVTMVFNDSGAYMVEVHPRPVSKNLSLL